MLETLGIIRSKMAAAALRSGRRGEDVTLLAVSKTHPAEAVQAAAAMGLELFGESRLQEAKEKISVLPALLRWHFIGHLQRNKIRAALPLFECFHGVDNLALAVGMNRIASEMDLKSSVLLEVNVSGEAAKFGFSPEELHGCLEELLALPQLQISGLMTMAPYSENAEDSRPCFSALREFRDKLESGFGIRLPVLSMGMSGDFEVGIEEGSTIVRIGTALFGSRQIDAKT